MGKGEGSCMPGPTRGTNELWSNSKDTKALICIFSLQNDGALTWHENW